MTPAVRKKRILRPAHIIAGIWALYADGVPKTQIAKEFSVHHNVVQKILKYSDKLGGYNARR